MGRETSRGKKIILSIWETNWTKGSIEVELRHPLVAAYRRFDGL
jgi:hypothetical protein